MSKRRPAGTGRDFSSQLDKYFSSDRKEARDIIDNLQFGSGSALKRAREQLWAARWDAFYEAWLASKAAEDGVALPTSLLKARVYQTPPDHEALIEFLVFISSRLACRFQSQGKTTLSEAYIQKTLNIIYAYLAFTYDGFELKKSCKQRIQSVLDDMVESGKVFRGLFRKKQWVGFMLTVKLNECLLQASIKYGVRTFDNTVVKMLSIAFLAATGMRAGDLQVSSGYSNQCRVNIGDIQLTVSQALPPPQDEDDYERLFASIRAKVVFKYIKGAKTIENKDFLCHISPLVSENKAACPIALLLVHALRHSLVTGETIEEVLQEALTAPGGQIKWTQPGLPLLPAFELGTRYVLLDKPAKSHQLVETAKQVSRLAGLGVTLVPHDFRRGAAKELSMLEGTYANGWASAAVAHNMGHSLHTWQKGVTQEYVGEPADDPLKLREALSSTGTARSPQIITGRKRPFRELVTDQEKDHFSVPSIASSSTDYTDPSSSSSLQALGAGLIRQHEFEAATDIAETLDEEEKENPLPDSDIDLMLSTIATAANGSDTEETSAATDADELSPEDEEWAFAAPDQEGILALPIIQYINKMAQYNVVRNAKFGLAQKGLAALSKEKALHGGSRDKPTPYLFHCRNAPSCNYSYSLKHIVERHEINCKVLQGQPAPARVVEEPTPVTSTARQRQKSLRENQWVPIQCQHGCLNAKVFKTRSEYHNHQIEFHEYGWEPIPCPLQEDCKSKRTFETRLEIRRHLLIVHKLSTEISEEMLPVRKADPPKAMADIPKLGAIPYTPKSCPHSCSRTIFKDRHAFVTHMTRYHEQGWDPMVCPRLGHNSCDLQQEFTIRRHLIEHLRNIHGMELAAAKALLPPAQEQIYNEV